MMKHKFLVTLAFLGLGVLLSAGLFPGKAAATVGHDVADSLTVAADNDSANINSEYISFSVSGSEVQRWYRDYTYIYNDLTVSGNTSLNGTYNYMGEIGTSYNYIGGESNYILATENNIIGTNNYIGGTNNYFGYNSYSFNQIGSSDYTSYNTIYGYENYLSADYNFIEGYVNEIYTPDYYSGYGTDLQVTDFSFSVDSIQGDADSNLSVDAMGIRMSSSNSSGGGTMEFNMSGTMGEASMGYSYGDRYTGLYLYDGYATFGFEDSYYGIYSGLEATSSGTSVGYENYDTGVTSGLSADNSGLTATYYNGSTTAGFYADDSMAEIGYVNADGTSSGLLAEDSTVQVGVQTSTGSFHGLTVDGTTNTTTLSGGTSSTTLTLSDSGATISDSTNGTTFSVDNSGNTGIAGTLTVEGDTTLNNNLYVDSNGSASGGQKLVVNDNLIRATSGAAVLTLNSGTATLTGNTITIGSAGVSDNTITGETNTITGTTSTDITGSNANLNLSINSASMGVTNGSTITATLDGISALTADGQGLSVANNGDLSLTGAEAALN